MNTIEDQALAARVATQRHQKHFSQADLAEAAGVSIKTVQRLEAGQAVSGRSRRSIFEVLDIGDIDLQPAPEPPVDATWERIDDAAALMTRLRRCTEWTVEVQNGKDQRADLRWSQRGLIISTGDPLQSFLELVDEISAADSLRPGASAQAQRKLERQLKLLERMGWAVAVGTGPPSAHLFLGSDKAVSARLDRPP